MLAWLIGVLLAGGVLALIAERWDSGWPRWVALGVLIVDALVLGIGLQGAAPAAVDAIPGQWYSALEAAWIPRFGISFLLAMDGLSLALVVLTLFLGVVAVVASWSEVTERTGFFHANLLWTLAGTVGVFTALDLFLFFFFWEVMLVPMYLIIAIWGHEARAYAAMKFFLFTQVSGLLMLMAIVALVLTHYAASGSLTFSYFELQGVLAEGSFATWIMLGFFAAFVVKLSGVPFHTWLPDAHTQAPAAGSVILAGVLLKTGGYGLLRFLVPLFPDAAMSLQAPGMALGAVSVLYGGVLAYAQSDFKRLVAYSSVAHMGFVLLGVFTWNTLAVQGAVMQMVAHGLSTAALFMLAGLLQERLQTREMGRMGGLWMRAPRMGAVGLFFVVASLGMPGLANFIGEFMVLIGAFRVNMPIAVIAALGMVVAAIYALALMQRTFQGAPHSDIGWMPDLDGREMTVMVLMMVSLVWLGFHPQTLFDVSAPAVEGLGRFASARS